MQGDRSEKNLLHQWRHVLNSVLTALRLVVSKPSVLLNWLMQTVSVMKLAVSSNFTLEWEASLDSLWAFHGSSRLWIAWCFTNFANVSMKWVRSTGVATLYVIAFQCYAFAVATRDRHMSMITLKKRRKMRRERRLKNRKAKKHLGMLK